MESKVEERFTEEPQDKTSAPLMSLHTHTDLSLCGRPDMIFEAVVETTVELGFFMVGLSDHVHPPTITDYPQHIARLRGYKERRDELGSSVKIAIGGEFEVAAPGRIIESKELVEVCEYIIVSPNHYHLSWIETPAGSAADMASHELDNIETIIAWPHADAVAHPFASGVLYKACDKGRLRDLFRQAIEKGIAFEIQPKFWYDPQNAGRPVEFFEIWLEMGGKVALGSDAHTLSSLRIWTTYFQEIVAYFKITRDNMWWPEKKKE